MNKLILFLILILASLGFFIATLAVKTTDGAVPVNKRIIKQIEGVIIEDGSWYPIGGEVERTKVNGSAFGDGTERFLINVAETPYGHCLHADLVTPEDCKEDAKAVVYVNWRAGQHYVCWHEPQSGMFSAGQRCLDLYDITER